MISNHKIECGVLTTRCQVPVKTFDIPYLETRIAPGTSSRNCRRRPKKKHRLARGAPRRRVGATIWGTAQRKCPISKRICVENMEIRAKPMNFAWCFQHLKHHRNLFFKHTLRLWTVVYVFFCRCLLCWFFLFFLTMVYLTMTTYLNLVRIHGRSGTKNIPTSNTSTCWTS